MVEKGCIRNKWFKFILTQIKKRTSFWCIINNKLSFRNKFARNDFELSLQILILLQKNLFKRYALELLGLRIKSFISFLNNVTLKFIKTVELSNLSKVSKFTSYFKISSFINTFTIDIIKKFKKS